MAETNDQGEPHIPTALILRMTARLWRLPPQRRDAYVSRARAHFDAGRGSADREGPHVCGRETGLRRWRTLRGDARRQNVVQYDPSGLG